jgi:SGNH domain (fused to AT3 domains)
MISYKENCTFGAPGVAPDTAVWGDSHGAELAVALGKRFEGEGRGVMEITSSACPPALNYISNFRKSCPSHNDETINNLIKDNNIRNVILTNDFAAYGYNNNSMLDGYFKAIEKLIYAGKEIIIVYPIPLMAFDPPSRLGIASYFGQKLNNIGISSTKYYEYNSYYIKKLDEYISYKSIKTIRPDSIFCDETLCHAYLYGNGVLYFNYSHLSIAGAEMLVKFIP